jgi:phage-related protein
MGFLIFRGAGTEGSASIVGSGNVLTNVALSQMPDHRKAKKRYTEYYVKGRDGALHVDEGYANFEITAVLVLLDASAVTRQVVNAWADGTGKLILSDDLTRAYNATVEKEVKWKRVQGNAGFFDTADVIFNCQPCMVQATETPQVFTQSGTIVNLGTADAYPLLAIEGSGDTTVTIAGEEITIDDMTAGTPVYIDCETGYIWSEENATAIHGNIPYFPVGSTSSITLGTNATKVTVTPHWRWV